MRSFPFVWLLALALLVLWWNERSSKTAAAAPRSGSTTFWDWLRDGARQ